MDEKCYVYLLIYFLKDARSVSQYPSNHSRILQYGILNGLTFQKELQNFLTKNVFWTKK